MPELSTLDLDALSAPEIDTLIRQLAAKRAGMQPVHPAEPPNDPGQIHHADNMLWHVRASRTERALEIAMYHPGLGWTSMLMSRAQIEDLDDAIVYALRDMPDVVNLAAAEHSA